MLKTKEAKLVGVEFIAELIHKTPATVRVDLARRPKSLPPRLIIPNSRKLLWLESDVMAWLDELRDY
tara:strand:+ start:311 stop:511 length:201 start_codon:yes stop_codon:yes gene_type:complete